MSVDWKDLKKQTLENNKELQKEYEILKMRTNIIRELYNYRIKNNLTQKEFAKKIGVHQQVISRFEKGEIDPRFSFISKILLEIEKPIEKFSFFYEIPTNIISNQAIQVKRREKSVLKLEINFSEILKEKK